MPGSGRREETAGLFKWKTAKDAGCITQCLRCVLVDPDAHADQARKHGAEIIRGPYDNPGRAYDVEDLEGNVWNFGRYDPWA